MSAAATNLAWELLWVVVSLQLELVWEQLSGPLEVTSLRRVFWSATALVMVYQPIGVLAYCPECNEWKPLPDRPGPRSNFEGVRYW